MYRTAKFGPAWTGGPAPKVTNQQELERFLDDLEAQKFLLSIGVTIEYYHQTLGREPHLLSEFTRLSNDLYSRKDYADVIEQWRGKVRDSLIEKRLEIHHKDCLLSRAGKDLLVEFGNAQIEYKEKKERYTYKIHDQEVTTLDMFKILKYDADRKNVAMSILRARLKRTYCPSLSSAV